MIGKKQIFVATAALLVIIVIVLVALCFVLGTKSKNIENIESSANEWNSDENEIRTIEATIDDYERIIRQRYEQLAKLEQTRKHLLKSFNERNRNARELLEKITTQNNAARQRLLNQSILLGRIDAELRNLDDVRKIVEFKRRTKRYIEDDKERNEYFKTLYTNVSKRQVRYCNNETPPK